MMTATMSNETVTLEALPRIVQAGRETTVTLRPRDPQARLPAAAWRVAVVPLGGLDRQTRHPEATACDARLTAEGLTVSLVFPSEQEYALLVERVTDGTPAAVADVRVYAVAADLFARRPFKGDFHIHSNRSDGREPPAHVAGACRRIGMDFMALTDHRQYAPSLEAIAAFANTGTDLRIFPGEEVHSPDTSVHIVSFGGRWSVNDLFATDRYRQEVAARAAAIAGLPGGTDPLPYVACEWCFDEIRRAGGLGMFCHPYWVCRSRLDVPAALTDLLFERQPFDALEVIGGYYVHESESNHLQVTRYYTELAQGRRIPIVGASDAHGCERPELFGWYYSIVFAASPDLQDVIGAVRDFNAVAVDAMNGQPARAVGPFRLVRYAQFLLREVLPRHDALCVEEGRLMVAHAAGDTAAAEQLRALGGQVARLYATLWG